MMIVRRFLFISLMLVYGQSFAQELPSRLSNEQFWELSTSLSEPDGRFRSDNLLSNEAGFQDLIRTLIPVVKPGRVYLGVGPEQNFTYIAAFRPKMAFIVDIRRGNLNLQLMYKALFELSRDRADFVSRLFSRKRPAALNARSSANDIFTAYGRSEPSEELFEKNLRDIRSRLTEERDFPLTENDLLAIEEIYQAFFRFGPDIDYNSSSGGRDYRGELRSYAELMSATDQNGQARSFLGNESYFRVVRDLQTRNLIVPVVGNFAGSDAIQSVGQYIERNGGLVSAFYLSNVEQYLRASDSWGLFCANAQMLPVDESSVFIRAVPDRTTGLRLASSSIYTELSLTPCTQ